MTIGFYPKLAVYPNASCKDDQTGWRSFARNPEQVAVPFLRSKAILSWL